MKRLVTLFVLASMSLALALPVAAETKLRITLQLPLKSHLGQNLLQFKEEVERESNGDLVVEIYDSAQLYKDKEVPQAVASGAIEMGVASLTRFAGTIPAVDVFYVPFMFHDEEMVRAATNPDGKIRQLLDQAILDTGTRVLWWQAYGGAIMLSKDDPLTTPKEIEGKKVRVFGKTLGEFVKALGGSPTLISGSEQYLAYQRGTVDAGMTGISGVKSRKLWQVMNWVTVTNHADIEFVVLVNEKFWEGLTDEQRAIIETAARNAEMAVRDEVSRIEEEAYRIAEENGMQVQTLAPEQIDEWRAATQPVVDQYLSQSGDLGQQVLEAATELRQ
jgi:C4-dicarboxylate-binding protein DctP